MSVVYNPPGLAEFLFSTGEINVFKQTTLDWHHPELFYWAFSGAHPNDYHGSFTSVELCLKHYHECLAHSTNTTNNVVTIDFKNKRRI